MLKLLLVLYLFISNAAVNCDQDSIEGKAKVRRQNLWELSGKFEGDIILPDPIGFRNGIIFNKFHWPNRTLPYEIDDVFTEKEKRKIINSLEYFNRYTCIKIKAKTSSDVDYVYVTGDNKGCWSLVGRVGGPQKLNLQRPGCLITSIIQHEFLHALGFYHQQSSKDRDNYIKIIWKNIPKKHWKNFVKIRKSTNFNVSYDYNSLMHYSPYAFSLNGEPTIESRNPNVKFGTAKHLSKSDIIKLHRMYNCTLVK